MYYLYDGHGRCLYIGRSADIRGRLVAHYASKDWFTQVRRVHLDGPYTYAESLRAERQAISRHTPAHNVTHNEKRASA